MIRKEYLTIAAMMYVICQFFSVVLAIHIFHEKLYIMAFASVISPPVLFLIGVFMIFKFVKE